MSMNQLIIQSITKKFGDLKALDNLSFAVPEGRIFGLIGPNGAGKTTTIRCITGLMNIDAGNIEIFGKNIEKDSIEIRKNIGVLFENMDDLFVYLKGQEHLEFVGQVYGLPKKIIDQRIDDLFEYFEMESHRYILIDDYSKGMKKKIALASVLLHKPDLIILDEPFEGLDTITIIKVKDLLRKLKNQGCSILVTSHILSYIEDLCDEVAIINKGELIFQGLTETIRKKLKDNTTGQTYSGLEELFQHLVAPEERRKTLSWLE